eukprot:TRINITY_DN1814_c0_g1_i2.p1 TRINITY_DN1814_c0_g1~~TRINITY_DN1814_c0_g1_i2.p1  ORF type:complete len:354 (+),score=65.34 TRINITY_DN1814_c0_g1_i2:415-1476(+)
MKVHRWYDTVKVAQVPENDLWTVLLDGRTLITRTERGLYLPTEELATLVASDWESQDGMVSYAKMPIMLMTAKAIDDVQRFRDGNTNELIEILNCDLVCLREQKQMKFEKLQEEKLQPILEKFVETTGLMLDVSKEMQLNHRIRTVDTIRVYLSTLDSCTFMYFYCLVTACKSFVLSICLWHGFIDVDEAISAVRLEEDFQSRMNGFIEGAHDISGTSAYLDVLTPALILRTSGVLPPTKESLLQFGDCTQVLHEEARDAYEQEKYRLEHIILFYKKQLNDKIEAGKKVEEFEAVSIKSILDVTVERIQNLKEKWDKTDESFIDRKKKRDIQECSLPPVGDCGLSITSPEHSS